MADRSYTDLVDADQSKINWPVRPLTLFTGFPWALLVIVFATFEVLVRLPSHFWLDETLGYWVAHAGFHQIWVRCTLYPQSIPYSFLILMLQSMGAKSEWIYRLPSFLAIAASTFLLFRMSRRVFGSEAAWMITAVFLSMDLVRFAAGDARPHALALLCSVIASDLLLRFLDHPSHRLAVFYGLAAAAMLYFQLLFGAVLLAHLLYWLYRISQGKPSRWPYIATAVGVLMAFAAPLAFQYIHFAGGNMPSHAFAKRPTWSDLATAYMPAALLFVIEILGALILLMPKVTWQLIDSSGPSVFFVFWAIVPPVVLFTFSLVTHVSLFVPRYFLPYSTGLAICFGLVFVSFKPPLARAVILSTMAVLVAWSIGRPTSFRHTVTLGDWGAAAKFINSDVAKDNAPVLIRSQFPESDFMPLQDMDNGNFSQLAYYPIKARLVPLQNTFTAAQASSIDSFLRSDAVHKAGRFLLVSFNGPAPLEPLLYYIYGRLGSEFKLKRLADFDGLSIDEFLLPGR